jgi:hypothetical protein
MVNRRLPFISREFKFFRPFRMNARQRQRLGLELNKSLKFSEFKKFKIILFSPILLSSQNTGLANKMTRQKWFEFELTMFL